MKRILLSGVAVAVLSSVAGCAPYYWEDNYKGDHVNLDGPLRRNIEYVNGGTVFEASSDPVRVETVGLPQATNLRVAPQQVIYTNGTPANVQLVAGQPVQVYGQNFGGSVMVPAGSTAFAAPQMAAVADPTVATVNVATQPMVYTGQMLGQTVGQTATVSNNAIVPSAYANAGDPANLQTRRVGDVGLIVFSNLISDETAKGAAQRSCAQISKTATTSVPQDIQLGVRQLNFRCG